MWEDRYPWDETTRIRDTELYKPVNITSSPGCNRDLSNAIANDNIQAGKSSRIPKRPLTVVPANAKFNKTERLLKETVSGKALVTGWDMDPLRPAIIDSGCSSDTHPMVLATKKFPEKIRPLIKEIQFDTAADPVTCKHGATVKFGVWDIPLDVCLSPGDPSLISVGQRVMEAGMSFFWLAGRAPCFITADYKYIVVFVVSTNVPEYAPCLHVTGSAAVSN